MNNKAREITHTLLRVYDDKFSAYAAVCNHIIPSCPDEELIAVKRYLEHLITCDVMEEYGWERTDTGWRKVENDEFWARFREELEATQNKE